MGQPGQRVLIATGKGQKWVRVGHLAFYTTPSESALFRKLKKGSLYCIERGVSPYSLSTMVRGEAFRIT